MKCDPLGSYKQEIRGSCFLGINSPKDTWGKEGGGSVPSSPVTFVNLEDGQIKAWARDLLESCILALVCS